MLLLGHVYPRKLFSLFLGFVSRKSVRHQNGPSYDFLEFKSFRLVVIATHRDDDPADEEEEGDEELPEDDLQKKDKKKKPDVS